MARRRKSKGMSRRTYFLLLTLWVIALTAAAAFGLSKVWSYAEEFEQAQPEPVMDEYVASLNANLSNETIRNTMADMDHEMQSDEECVEIIESMLSGGVTYSRGPSAGREGSICYILKCGQGSFGKVWLREDKSVESQYSMYPWEIYEEEFDFTGLYTGVQVTVPESYSVWLNGNKLDEEYIIEKDIPYDVLKDYYEDYEGLPTKCTYRFDNIIGKLEPVIKNEEGQEVTIDTALDDSQYLRSCSDAELEKLQSFAEGFTERYYVFAAGLYDPTYAYQRLKPYIKTGSDLDERLKLAFDGLYFAHTKDVKTEDIKVTEAQWLADGIFLCRISAHVTTHEASGQVSEKDENMKLIIVENGGDYRAVSQELY